MNDSFDLMQKQKFPAGEIIIVLDRKPNGVYFLPRAPSK